MAEAVLTGLTVLVAEDEYMLAADLRRELASAGATVVGPAASLAKALDLISKTEELDAAILDVNLRGEAIFAAADVLAERGLPFVFTTGYDQSLIPSRFTDVIRCEKPVSADELGRVLMKIVLKN